MQHQDIKIGDRVYICTSAWKNFYRPYYGDDIPDIPKMWRGIGTIGGFVFGGRRVSVIMDIDNLRPILYKSYLVKVIN